MAIVCSWRRKVYKCDAETAHNEINKLDEKTAENVVELARPEDNPLHDDFDWRDDIAGQKWRIHQAHMMLCNLIVKCEEICSDPEAEVRAFISVEEKSVYKPIEVVLKSEDDYNYMLNKAKRELQAFKRKYATLQELKPLFAMIDEL